MLGSDTEAAGQATLPQDPTGPGRLKPVDVHVHVVGTGAGGTGCWLRPKGWRRGLLGYMLRHVGLSTAALAGDFDRLYVERLVELVRGSSLGAAVILAHDLVRDDQGRAIDGVSPFYVPNDYVLRLARQYPELWPGVSIHPARPDALEELERCLAGGAVLMKCLPCCHNIDCSDRRYTPFWERMAEAGLPLLAHTGEEFTLPMVRPDWTDPRLLRRPLEIGVVVIAAHCATGSGLGRPDYFPVFARMLEQFPNLYGDTSGLNTPARAARARACLREPVVSRLLHGSDFPVPVLGHWAWLAGVVGWSEMRRAQRLGVLERDYQLKRAMGFGDAHFTRAHGLLRRKPKAGS